MSEPKELKEPQEAPLMYSKEWPAYVKSLLDLRDEKDNPKADDVRRVAMLLFDITCISSEIIQHPTFDSPCRATVKCTVEYYQKGNSVLRKAVGHADVGPDNTGLDFLKYALATAETRAEGRVMRKILGLTNTHVEEEIDQTTEVDLNKPIPESMVGALKAMCNTRKISFNSLCSHMSFDSNALTVGQGKKIVAKIHEYQNSPENIPESVKS